MEKEELCKILGLDIKADWSEIFVEIGKLQERAIHQFTYTPPTYTDPPTPDPYLHYHNGIPCHNNPCYWSGT